MPARLLPCAPSLLAGVPEVIQEERLFSLEIGNRKEGSLVQQKTPGLEPQGFLFIRCTAYRCACTPVRLAKP